MESVNISLFAALVAGILSFVSPCILPMVPVYIGYMSSAIAGQEEEKAGKKALFQALLFVLGFSLIFVTMGSMAGLLGYTLNEHLPLLRKVGGAVLMLFGLHIMGVLPLPWLYYEKRLDYRPATIGAVTPFFIGMVFALGWTPCIGPILAGILLLASDAATVAQGALLLAVYSLGLGMPFLATSLALSRASRLLKKINRYYRVIEVTSGLFLIGIGLLLFTNTLQRLSGFFSWVPPL